MRFISSLLLLCGISSFSSAADTYRTYRTVPRPPHEQQRQIWERAVNEIEAPSELDPQGNWADEAEGCQMSLRFQTGWFGKTTNIFRVKESITALVLVRNVIEAPCGVLDCLSFNVTKEGQRVRRQDEMGIHVFSGGAPYTNFFFLQPHTQRSFTKELTHDFDFGAPGEYVITAVAKVPKRGSVKSNPQKQVNTEAEEMGWPPIYSLGEPTFPDVEYVEIKSAAAIIHIVSADFASANNPLPATENEQAISTVAPPSDAGRSPHQNNSSTFQRATREAAKTPSLPTPLAEASPSKPPSLTLAQKIGAGIVTLLTALLLWIVWRAKARQHRSP